LTQGSKRLRFCNENVFWREIRAGWRIMRPAPVDGGLGRSPRRSNMQLFNRLFAILMAIAWGALLGWLLWVVWRPSQSASIEGSKIQFSLGLSLTTSEQILGTIILVALMVPALLLFGI